MRWLFLLGNLVSALAGGYAVLLAGRLLTAVAHGSFFAVGATVAAQLADKGREAQAIALMFAGLTLAMVVGVLLGSLLGNGLGWRLPFFAVAVLAALGLAATALWRPPLAAEAAAPVKSQLAALRRPPVWVVMALTALGFGASFAAFTFITPILTGITDYTVQTANGLLVLFGATTLAGNMAGGRWAARYGWHATLAAMLGALALLLAVMSFALPYPQLMPVFLFFWGILAFGMTPAFQAAMLDTAARCAPQAAGFASALNIAAFNVGITAGTAAGSLLTAHGAMAYTPAASAAIAATALLPLVLLQRKAA